MTAARNLQKKLSLEECVLEKIGSVHNGAALDDITTAFPDENRGRIKSVLFNLCSDGLVQQGADGVYRITGNGEENIAEQEEIPVPPVPLTGLDSEVYTFVAKSRTAVSLDSIAAAFPNENRGRIKSVLFNLCGDSILRKENTASGDVYSLKR